MSHRRMFKDLKKRVELDRGPDLFVVEAYRYILDCFNGVCPQCRDWDIEIDFIDGQGVIQCPVCGWSKILIDSHPVSSQSDTGGGT